MKAAAAAWTLLAALAAPLTAAAQVAPPPTGATQMWKEINEQAAKGDAERQREADRLFEEARLRANLERSNKLRAALEKDQAALDQPRQLLVRLFQLPASLTLSDPHRALAEAALSAHRQRAEAAWPAWQQLAVAQVAGSADTRSADAEQVALLLSMRLLNEAALWFADAEPQASDGLWIEALQRGGLCQQLAGVEPAALMAALIEALPPEHRADAWAGEAQRLARWGLPDRAVLAPPERALADALSPSPAGQPLAQRCERLRAWSQEQIRRKRFSPLQALRAWRSALAVRSADFLLSGQPRSGADALDPAGFPKLARRLGLSGRVFVEQDVDASGKLLRAFIQRRELSALSLGKQPALAVEHELDRATLDRVAAMPATAPEPSTLRDGFATQRVGIEWLLD